MSEESKRAADETAEAEESAESAEPAAQDISEVDPVADGNAGGEQDDEEITLEVTEAAPSRAPLVLAVFACLLALGSAAGVAYLWLQQPPDETALIGDQVRDLSNQLRETSQAMQRNESALQDLRAENSQASGGVDDVRRTLEQRLRPLEAIPGRLSNLEASLSALQGISSGLRDTWLLAEAEYYLQIANAQLELAANPQLASIALELADERLASLGNPALTDVRRQVADELRELAAMNDMDLEGAVLTLGSLADAIESLPLKNDIEVPVDERLPLDTEQTGMARAMASLKSAVSDVISVRRSDTAVTPLLPPEAAYFLRNNLTLQLQTARLAMLRGEQAVFDASLADAADWIADYYDAESRAVDSAQETITELRDLQLSVSKPDISGSLTALRQFIALRDERERAEPGNAQ